jgi:hypothetical protein
MDPDAIAAAAKAAAAALPPLTEAQVSKVVGLLLVETGPKPT